MLRFFNLVSNYQAKILNGLKKIREAVGDECLGHTKNSRPANA
jgi:hypothetical protein